MVEKEKMNKDVIPNDNSFMNSAKLLAQAGVRLERNQPSNEAISNNYFKSAEWSPDGTCIITNSADNHVRTFIVPPDLLEHRSRPLNLESYSRIPSFEPVNAVICYPRYYLQDSSTTLILSTANEHPIRLNSALTGNLVASYPLVSSTTEAYIKPRSLVFSLDGSHFVAGSHSLISTFDVSRPGDPPVSSFKTGPRHARTSWSNPATSVRGLVSALDIDPQYNVLASGTLTRQIGLYDAAGRGECIGAFSVSGTEADKAISGSGITQTKWSQCGRYLYVVERKSDGALVYDIRNTGQLLCWMVGRKSMTNQRSKVDLAPDHGLGQDMWAGGTDGVLRCWSSPRLSTGAIEPSWQSELHEDHINSTSIHQTAEVFATAGGQRDFIDADSESDTLDPHPFAAKSLLKLWTISLA